jgi:hypothetical protein
MSMEPEQRRVDVCDAGLHGGGRTTLREQHALFGISRNARNLQPRDSRERRFAERLGAAVIAHLRTGAAECFSVGSRGGLLGGSRTDGDYWGRRSAMSHILRADSVSNGGVAGERAVPSAATAISGLAGIAAATTVALSFIQPAQANGSARPTATRTACRPAAPRPTRPRSTASTCSSRPTTSTSARTRPPRPASDPIVPVSPSASMRRWTGA